MALEPKIIKKICDFVYIKPRTVQEVANLVGKNWRTADRYIEKISEETGYLSVRTFRGGTQGALKVVFWNNIEKIHSTAFQENLYNRIERTIHKRDFNPFDIWQYVPKEKRGSMTEAVDFKTMSEKQDMGGLLRNSEKEVLIFSGNLSWVSLSQGKDKMVNILEEIAKRNISIKILTSINLEGINNIKSVLAINERLGRNIIEIRHRVHPLRGVIIDNKIARFKEIKDPSYFRPGELNKNIFIYYDIFDEEWVEWIKKVFWNFFRVSISAEDRIKSLREVFGNLF